MQDDPIIRSMERSGLPPWMQDNEQFCPVCGETCETIYYDKFGEMVGCENCVTRKDAWEALNNASNW